MAQQSRHPPRRDPLPPFNRKEDVVISSAATALDIHDPVELRKLLKKVDKNRSNPNQARLHVSTDTAIRMEAIREVELENQRSALDKIARTPSRGPGRPSALPQRSANPAAPPAGLVDHDVVAHCRHMDGQPSNWRGGSSSSSAPAQRATERKKAVERANEKERARDEADARAARAAAVPSPTAVSFSAAAPISSSSGKPKRTGQPAPSSKGKKSGSSPRQGGESSKKSKQVRFSGSTRGGDS